MTYIVVLFVVCRARQWRQFRTLSLAYGGERSPSRDASTGWMTFDICSERAAKPCTACGLPRVEGDSLLCTIEVIKSIPSA